MSIFFHRYILLLFLLGPVCLVAQNKGDTASAVYADSLAENQSDSIITDESAGDSLYQPVADSFYTPSGMIREVPVKQVSRFKNDPEYAYANDPEYWRKEPYREPGIVSRILFSRALRWILLTLIAGFIVYGIYSLAKENHFGLLIRRRNPGLSGVEQVIPDEEMDYDEAILRSQAEGNYGMATRFLYLRLIRILREKSGVPFGNSSTNSEIIRAMGNHPQAANFRWLATAYEHIFYGGFVPNQELYEKLKSRFETIQKNFSA